MKIIIILIVYVSGFGLALQNKSVKHEASAHTSSETTYDMEAPVMDVLLDTIEITPTSYEEEAIAGAVN